MVSEDAQPDKPSNTTVNKKPALKVQLWTIPYENAVEGLLLPILRTHTHVIRMVGYFTAGFIKITKDGWAPFARNGGTMRLVCSHDMADNDRRALIRAGRMTRAEFARIAEHPKTSPRKLLSAAVASGVLEPKIVQPASDGYLFHAKTGAAGGGAGGPVVWSGSANDTKSGWTTNYEQVISFHGPAAEPLAHQVKVRFDQVWNQVVPDYKVVRPSEATVRKKTS